MSNATVNPTVTYAVTIPIGYSWDLAKFLRRHGAPFQPEQMALRLNDSENDPQHLIGHETAPVLRAVNEILRQSGLTPLVPGTPATWTLPQLHEFLELAMEHFSWNPGDRRPSGAWWLDQGIAWSEIAEQFPELFGPESDFDPT